MPQRSATLRVEVPKPGDDKPRLGRVAVITLLGFAIGVLWPRLAGIKLVPGAPAEAAESAVAQSSAEPPGSEAPPAAKAVPAEAPEPQVGPAPPSERIKVGDPKITSCRDEAGAKKSSCDALEIDAAARPKLLALAACKGSENVQGTLSLGLELDFESGKVKDVLKGKSTTLPDASATALIECAKKEFSTLSLAGVKHQHPSYTLFYVAELLPADAKPEPAGDAGSEVVQASGRATVSWEVAIVREHPKDGEILARVMRGTRVIVTGRDGDWYRIKYDAKGSEGWVFRTAIGM